MIDDYLVKIEFDDWSPSKGVRLRLSQVLKNRVCGLLGNMNDINDVELPIAHNTHVANLQNQFIRPEFHEVMTFQFNGFEVLSCEDPQDEPSACTVAELQQYREVCEIINEDPFINCDENTDTFIDNCVYDLCQGIDESEVICAMLSTFVDKCNARDEPEQFVISWRTNELCPSSFACGENQYFDSCGQPECQATTTQCVVDNGVCQSSVSCAEGCYCNEGYLLNDLGDCVGEEFCDNRSSEDIIDQLRCKDPSKHVLFNPSESGRIYSSFDAGLTTMNSSINSRNGWRSGNNQTGEYMNITLASGVDTVIDAIAIQGRAGNFSEWVTSFKAMYFVEGGLINSGLNSIKTPTIVKKPQNFNNFAIFIDFEGGKEGRTQCGKTLKTLPVFKKKILPKLRPKKNIETLIKIVSMYAESVRLLKILFFDVQQ